MIAPITDRPAASSRLIRGLGTVLLTLGVALGLALGLTLGASSAAAQSRPPEPHLAYAFPAGCQQGTSCEIVLGGQHLKEVGEAYLAGEGVQVEILKWYRPMTDGEFNQVESALRDAREKLIEQGNARPSEAEVVAAAGVSEDQLREREIHRLRRADPKRQPNEQLEEELTLRITVEKDAEPGKRELRLLNETAMSNPLWIQVGRFAESGETEPNDARPDGAAIRRFPVVVNGRVMPGDVDRFSFDALQGQRLVIEAGARDVIPYLADAVPGWFQAVMELTDSDGNEVSYADSFHYRQDPVIYFEVPRDGRYVIEIRDSLYRGREDFVYRLTLGEIPFVTSVFPLGAGYSSTTTVELRGWNLTTTSVEVRTMSRERSRPVHWCTVPQGDGMSVRVPLQIDRLPEVFDREPNDSTAAAQEVPVRTNVNGRIDRPGDQDVFFIPGRTRLVAEIHARRHGSPLDSMLTLTDAHGREIAFNDDHEDKSLGLLTHHADSHLEATVPSSGAYLHVGDAQRSGGAEFVYRLSLRAPEPDYELRVTPGTIIARAGAVTPVTVHALRRDGFDGDIELALEAAPEGFQLSGGLIPGNADRVQLTLTAPDSPPDGPVVLEMVSRARLPGRSSIERAAVPAENMMQAFAWHHLIPVEDWTVVVSGRPGARRPFDIPWNAPKLSLPRGGELIVPVRPLAKDVPGEQLRVEINEPKGVSAEIITGAGGQYALKLTTDPDEVEPGLRGNLLLRVFRELTPASTKANPNPKPQRTDYGYLPAVPFEISSREG
jgi:hypothetical protein